MCHYVILHEIADLMQQRRSALRGELGATSDGVLEGLCNGTQGGARGCKGLQLGDALLCCGLQIGVGRLYKDRAARPVGQDVLRQPDA